MLNEMDSNWRYGIIAIFGLIAGLYIGSMLATLYTMTVFGENLGTIKLTEPWFFRYPSTLWDSVPNVRNVASGITGIVTLGVITFGLASMYRGKLTAYGQAHWQSKPEMRRNNMTSPLSDGGFVYAKLSKPQVAGKFISADPDRWPHALMVAPTGSGKGVGFVIPQLLQFPGSAIVLDVKGDNFGLTSIFRKETLKQDVYYFSPFDSEHQTHRFNPMDRIAALPDTDQQYTAINTMIDLFLQVDPSSNAASFFTAGKRLLIASCLYAIEVGRPTIGDAAEIMAGGADKKQSYLSYAQETKVKIVRRTFEEMSDVPDKTLGSYVSVLEGAGLALWSDPSVIRTTSTSDFDFSTFRKKAQSLYIVVQPEHLKTLAPLIRLLFADAIACLQRSEPISDEKFQVMFLMDEFDQLGRMPIVETAIKTIRSFGGRFFIVSQNIPSLETLYRNEGRLGLQAGAGVQIYMTPLEERTAEVVSKLLGKKTIVSKSESGKRVRDFNDTVNISRRAEERPLVTPEDMLRFPLDKVIVLSKGLAPIKADHIRYYEDEYFLKLVKSQNGFSLPYPSGLIQPSRPELDDVVLKATADEASVSDGNAQVDLDALSRVQSLWDDLDGKVGELQIGA